MFGKLTWGWTRFGLFQNCVTPGATSHEESCSGVSSWEGNHPHPCHFGLCPRKPKGTSHAPMLEIPEATTPPLCTIWLVPTFYRRTDRGTQCATVCRLGVFVDRQVTMKGLMLRILCPVRYYIICVYALNFESVRSEHTKTPGRNRGMPTYA